MLEVNNLQVSFIMEGRELPILKNLSYNLDEGEVLALVGESGSGKSVHALALCSLLADNAKIKGSVKLEGKELLKLTPKKMRAVLGKKIAMIFQDPMTSLNPVLTIQSHFIETLQTHFKITKKTALTRAKDALKEVEIDETCLKKYPHQLSGGMRQRVMIALALCLIMAYQLGWIKIALVIFVFLLVQWSSNNLVKPVIFGKFLDLHPLLIILSLLLAAQFLGIWGVILAPAIASLIWILFDEVYIKTINKSE